MSKRLEIEFSHNGERGLVSVSCTTNDDPALVGKGEEARGFPMCTATIDYPGLGYGAFVGWIQLVCSTDNTFDGQAFEIDPARFFEDSPAPYCFYGLTPTLFDAPSRDLREPLDWLAHSFLAFTPRDAGVRKQAVPLVGFSWGFHIDRSGRIELAPVARLVEADWAGHVPYLRARYPSWEFALPAPLA